MSFCNRDGRHHNGLILNQRPMCVSCCLIRCTVKINGIPALLFIIGSPTAENICINAKNLQRFTSTRKDHLLSQNIHIHVGTKVALGLYFYDYH